MSEKEKHPILLVDDEPEILYSLQGLLRREFELYTAENGRQALQILQQHPIHVIMSDQRMPEMTGVQLMHRVKTEHPEAIRIVFTGYADLRAVVDAINNVGLYRYITKPWDPDELIEVLHQAAARYDEIVQRQRLLVDLREHVRQGQQLAQGLLEREPGVPPDRVPLDEFARQSGELLSRLDRATSAGAASSRANA
ncbi:MAG TPA: response regulator [Candidatus Anammoximicrobium sp.]|nr:response regulator [Candidatus Anammoximicrobium sp.]